MNRKNPRDIDEAELAKADATFYGIPALLGLESEFRNKDGRLEFESVELYGDGNGVRVELRRDSRKHPSEFEFEALSIEEHSGWILEARESFFKNRSWYTSFVSGTAVFFDSVFNTPERYLSSFVFNQVRGSRKRT